MKLGRALGAGFAALGLVALGLVPLALVSLMLGDVAVPPALASGTAIQPGNRPTPIPGATNGEVPSSDLVGVTVTCRVARAAGPSLELLLAAAHDRGLQLGTDECYRSLQGQQAEQQQWTAAGNSACAAPVTSSPSGQPQGTSMHGWGKAVDFSDGGGPLRFGSAAYQFLKAVAGSYGWNHPGWAEPGGSACPEAWHWEWVGDGGTIGAPPIRADVVSALRSGDGAGYASVSGLGVVSTRGDFSDQGSAGSMPINMVVVGAASSPDHGGYWLVAADGGVFSFGDARFDGSTGGTRLNAPIVGMASSPDGGGYWLVAADGGVFTFGDTHFEGSAAGSPSPAVAIVPEPSGRGYWVASADGEMAAFGDAPSLGPTP